MCQVECVRSPPTCRVCQASLSNNVSFSSKTRRLTHSSSRVNAGTHTEEGDSEMAERTCLTVAERTCLTHHASLSHTLHMPDRDMPSVTPSHPSLAASPSHAVAIFNLSSNKLGDRRQNSSPRLDNNLHSAFILERDLDSRL